MGRDHDHGFGRARGLAPGRWHESENHDDAMVMSYLPRTLVLGVLLFALGACAPIKPTVRAPGAVLWGDSFAESVRPTSPRKPEPLVARRACGLGRRTGHAGAHDSERGLRTFRG